MCYCSREDITCTGRTLGNTYCGYRKDSQYFYVQYCGDAVDTTRTFGISGYCTASTRSISFVLAGSKYCGYSHHQNTLNIQQQ